MRRGAPGWTGHRAYRAMPNARGADANFSAGRNSLFTAAPPPPPRAPVMCLQALAIRRITMCLRTRPCSCFRFVARRLKKRGARHGATGPKSCRAGEIYVILTSQCRVTAWERRVYCGLNTYLYHQGALGLEMVQRCI